MGPVFFPCIVQFVEITPSPNDQDVCLPRWDAAFKLDLLGYHEHVTESSVFIAFLLPDTHIPESEVLNCTRHVL